MKQITAFLLAFLFLLSLCACGGTKVDAPATPSATIPVKETPAPVESPAVLPDNDKKAPSDTLINEDITAALTEKNPHAAITSAEIEKSQTQDTSYYATLQLTAQSKYADFQYEADLYYTKYDQGWILDRVDWIDESYELVRYPGVAEMTTYAEGELGYHEVYSNPAYSHIWEYAEHMLPIKDAEVELIPADNGDSLINLSWPVTKAEKYIEYVYRISTLWSYDPEADCWALGPDKNSSVYAEHLTTTIYDLDYSGEWSLYNNFNFTKPPIGTLTISDFSWDRFSARASGDMRSSEYFTRTFDGELASIYNGNFHFVFKSESGKYFIVLIVQSSRVEFLFSTGDRLDTAVVGMIKETLPPLNVDTQP